MISIEIGRQDLKELAKTEVRNLPGALFAGSSPLLKPFMKKLEDLGIARLSLGPALLRAALSKMREVMQELLDYRDYASFTGSEILSSPDVRKILKL